MKSAMQMSTSPAIAPLLRFNRCQVACQKEASFMHGKYSFCFKKSELCNPGHKNDYKNFFKTPECYYNNTPVHNRCYVLCFHTGSGPGISCNCNQLFQKPIFHERAVYFMRRPFHSYRPNWLIKPTSTVYAICSGCMKKK